MIKRCPTCKQSIPSQEYLPSRICSKCGLGIGIHDKYKYVTRAGDTNLEHRHCDNTKSYLPKKVKETK